MNGSCVEWCWECTSTFCVCNDGNWMEKCMSCGQPVVPFVLVGVSVRY
jgi:hypothetical protein